MNKLSVVAVCALLGAASLGWLRSPQESATPLLSGAQPEIHASQYDSLQAAIDALPDEGGIVRLPPGTFEISQPLRIGTPDTTLVGCGAATRLINVNTEGAPAILIGHPEHLQSRPPAEQRLWRIRLADFHLSGNPASGHGLDVRFVEELFVQGVSVSHHGGDGLHLLGCYEDPRVSDCLITYNGGTGLNLIGNHDIVVSANQFEENQDALHCTDGFNLTMTGNAIDDHLGHGVVVENTYGSVISGNMIEECRGTAIVIDRDCYGITMSANVIAHNGGGIDLRDAHGCAVSANTFTIMKSDALRIGPASGRITVSGNNFSNSYIGDGVRRAEDDLEAAGLVLEQTTDICIVGNLFAAVRPFAIEQRGGPSRRVLMGDNVFSDTQTDDSGWSADALIADNLNAD